MSSKKKSQLSIFIIISLIIVFLLIFLFYLSFSDERKKVDGFESPGSAELVPLKEQIDFCLDRQLRRATLISGVRGGYLYDKGEYYTVSAIPKGTYPPEFISNMDLNWNNLLFKSLIHSQTAVYSPKLDDDYILTSGGEEMVIYDRGIKEDFENFILDEFVKCIDFENLENKGYEVEMEKFAASVSAVDGSNVIRSQGLEGKVGDEVELEIGNEKYLGVITGIGDGAVIQMSDSFSSISNEQELSDLRVVNIDSDISVLVNFTEDTIDVKLNFPVTIEGNGFSNTYSSLSSSIDVRYKNLLEFSQVLLEEKYKNKTLDLLNEEDLNYAIRSSGYSKDIEDIKIYKTVVNDTQTYKLYIYSIVDEQSRIFGNPYVFNFAYENKAPEIDTQKIGNTMTTEENIVFLVSRRSPIIYDLKPITHDEQAIDNFISYFPEQEYNGPDAKFTLSSDGKIYFEAYQEKRYAFTVSVSDFETRRDYNFIFLSGFPSNVNNTNAKKCFTYRNFHVPDFFPMANEFKDQIYNYTGGDGKINLYSYSLYLGELKNQFFGLRNSEVYFDSTCLFSYQFYEPEVRFKNLDTGVVTDGQIDEDTGKIIVPLSSSPLELSVSIYDKELGNLMTDPYTMTIYPASCLGPHPSSDVATYGADLSCCDTTPILNSIKGNSPQNFYSNSVLETTGKSIDTDAYFCFDMAQVYTNPNLGSYSFSHTTKDIWEGNPDATSLFEGHVSVVCDGSTAIGSPERITSARGDFKATANMVSTQGGSAPVGIPVSLDLVQSAGECEFCHIENPSPISLYIGNDYVLFSGIKSLNTGAGDVGVSTLPYTYNSLPLDDVHVMCDDSWYGSLSGVNDFDEWEKVSGDFGRGGEPSRTYSSRGYCYQGSTQCGGRPGTPGFGVKSDDVRACQDRFLLESGLFDVMGNTGWACGVNSTCSSGTCS